MIIFKSPSLDLSPLVSKGSFLLEYIFYVDPDTGKKHIEKHSVSVEEVVEFFNEINYLFRKRRDKSYVAYSKLKNGRFLEVVFRKLNPEKFFIITAYDVEDHRIIREIEERL